MSSIRYLLMVSLMALALLGLGAPKINAEDVAQHTPTTEDIETIVRDYLLKNPEIIVEALELLEQRREADQRAQQKQVISRNEGALYQSEHQIILGNPNGDITLIEFFDYNCGFCRQSLEHVEKLVEEDKNLRVILKEFPVLGPSSQEAARVAIAAAKTDPGKYLELHRRLLQARGQVNERIALVLSEGLGFDMQKIRSFMSEPVIDEAITEVYGIATQLGLTGTPTFIIGDEIMPGAVGYDVLRQKLDAMRQCGETVCS